MRIKIAKTILLCIIAQLAFGQVLLNSHTNIGGEKIDDVLSVMEDKFGNYLLFGGTHSYNFIGTSGAYQLNNTVRHGISSFMAKVSPDLTSKIWGTYFTYNNVGSLYMVDEVYDSLTNSIYILTNGNFLNYIHSPGTYLNYHTKGGPLLIRIDASNGYPVWSTFLGIAYFSGNGHTLCLDKSGNIYVGGTTSIDTAIATTGAFQPNKFPPKNMFNSRHFDDGFLMSFDSTGNKLYGTYIGGEQDDNVYGIKIQDSSLFVFGITNSHTNISTPGSWLEDIPAFHTLPTALHSFFLAKFDLKGNQIWSTYMPEHFAFEPLKDGGVLLLGGTQMDTLISTHHIANDTLRGFTDVFFMRLSSTGHQTMGRYLGGDTADLVSSLCKINDTTYGFSGITYSRNLDVVDPFDSTYNGKGDAFIGVIDDSLRVKSFSYYGGPEKDVAYDITYKAPFLAIVGYTQSSLATPGVYQTTLRGEDDGYIAKFVYDACNYYNPTRSFSTVSPLCYSQATGEASITATSQIKDYKFYWSNGSVDDTLKGVKQGWYTVTVSDTLGCAYIDSVEVKGPTQLVSALDVLDSLKCFGDANGSLMANTSGGIAPYSYLWNTTDTLNKIDNLAAGVYTVTVLDSNDCQNNLQLTLRQPDSLSINLTVTDETNNGAKDGSATALISGGTKDYRYTWSNGDTIFQATQLSNGSYSLTIKDKNGCQKSVEFTIQDLKVGIENHNDKRIGVFPNPTSGEFKVKKGDFSIKIIEVYSAIGQLVKVVNNEYDSEFIDLNIEDLKSGQYLILIKGDVERYKIAITKL